MSIVPSQVILAAVAALLLPAAKMIAEIFIKSIRGSEYKNAKEVYLRIKGPNDETSFEVELTGDTKKDNELIEKIMEKIRP